MKCVVIVFPGSNCDRDVAVAVERVCGHTPVRVWHGETAVPPADIIVLPGGFSHGDYLRCGAIAARSPIIADVVAKAHAGVPILGICNGFQILTEAGLLPGALTRNQGLRFVCKAARVRVESTETPFSSHYPTGAGLSLPVAHHDGNYRADDETQDRLEGEGRVVFRYVDADGTANEAGNPNGSAANIAGIVDSRRRILGMMPHPERAVDPLLGGTDGIGLFRSIMTAA